MNIVEYPRSSSLRASSRQACPSRGVRVLHTEAKRSHPPRLDAARRASRLALTLRSWTPWRRQRRRRLTRWHPASWRDYEATQLPIWPDPAVADEVHAELRKLPPLVFAGEARRLTRALAQVADGRAFLLQAGDCAESFDDFSADAIRDKLKVILQMAVVLTYGSGVPVLKVGRIAGQFAKPRSSPTERVGDLELPAFRGHIINDDVPIPSARVPDPRRMLRAYHQSASTLNLLRAFTKGGFADLSQVHSWNQQFVASSAEGRRYEAIAEEIDRAMRFMQACGVDLTTDSPIHQVDLFTSHEALLLDYEECLTRQDSLTGRLVRLLGPPALDRRAHPPDRQRPCRVRPRHREPDRRQARPGDRRRRRAAALRAPQPASGAGPADARHPHGRRQASGPPCARSCEAVDRRRAPGDLGVRPDARQHLRERVGRKTRHFDDVLGEIHGFFEVHRSLGTWPGGVHVELTGDDVTECLGGIGDILEEQLPLRYTTTCDPRLNARQSIDLAFRVAELLRAR